MSYIKLFTRISRSALVFVVILGIVTFWSMRHFPPLGLDSLIYHLSVPAFWLQQGFLYEIDLPFHDHAAEHAPMLAQCFVYLLMRLTSDDSLVFLLQPLCHVMILVCAVFTMKKMNIHRFAVMQFAALIFIFPPFFNSSQIANNDLLLTLGAAVFALGAICLKNGERKSLICCAGGIAIMSAGKTIGIIYSFAALAAIVPDLYRWLKNKDESGKKSLLTAVSVVIMLAGGFFYFRNWYLYGNPLFPASLSLFGQQIFSGLYNSSVLVNHGWDLSLIRSMFIHGHDAFSPRLPESVLLLAGFLISCAGNLFAGKRKSRLQRYPFLLAGFPVLSAVLFLLFVPFYWQNRLLFPVYYVMWLGAAWGIDFALRNVSVRLSPFFMALPLLSLLLYCIYKGMWQEENIALVVCCSLLMCVSVRFWRLFRRYWKYALPAVAAPLFIAAIINFGEFQKVRISYRESVYKSKGNAGGRGWCVIDRICEQSGQQTVAYAGMPLIYPLFGPKLQNRVVYVPLSKDDFPKPVKLKSDDHIYRVLSRARRKIVDETYWLEQVNKKGVDLLWLVDFPDISRVTPELTIIKRHPQKFSCIFREGNVTVWQV
ncbi:MAG: hypothetical protein ACYTFY_15310, partial [Planctomycetota bacterium]